MNQNLFIERKLHRPLHSKPSRTADRAVSIEPLEVRIAPSTLIGLTTTNQLVMFDSAEPAKMLHSIKLSGVPRGEDIVSIDARPADGLIYGISNAGSLYTLNPFSGVATLVGNSGTDLLGKSFAIDFNPSVDRVRIVSDAEQNIRFNPNNGALAGEDTNLTYDPGDPNNGQNPNIMAVAYDRNFQGTALTTLYGIDTTLNALVRIGGVDGTPSPNGGVITTVGDLGVNPGKRVGFDIAGDGNPGTAYATMQVGSKTGLFTIDLATGEATAVGKIGKGKLKLDAVTTLPREEIVFGVTATNRLISFRADNPGSLESVVTLTGLIAGELVTDIDFRPATGELFGLTNQNRMLSIDTSTGETTQLGAPIDAGLLSTAGARGFDFNPTVDRLRLVNTGEQNLRYNPLTQEPIDSDANPANGTTPDATLAFAAGDVNVGDNPQIGGMAYDRNDNDDISPPNTGTPTTLWAIDAGNDVLVTIGGPDGTPSPNLGSLFTVGTLVLGDGSTLDVTETMGFDIADNGTLGVGAALFVAQLNGETVSKLYSINLNSTGLTNQPQGSVKLLGTVAGGEVVTDMAIAPSTIQFSAPKFTAIEKVGSVAVITLSRLGGHDSVATVQLSTFDLSAIGGLDYTALINEPITFDRGETLKRIEISILDDPTKEPDESVLLSLASVIGGNTVLGSTNGALLTIRANK